MYRVIEMYGDCEPWWFLDGWEKDITASRQFEHYYDALKYYKESWLKLSEQSPSYKSRSDLMTIFWDPKDQEWCEGCNEYVQKYHSLFLLEDGQKIPKSKLRPGYNKQNANSKHRVCSF